MDNWLTLIGGYVAGRGVINSDNVDCSVGRRRMIDLSLLHGQGGLY